MSREAFHTKTSREIADKWAKYTVERFIKNIDKLKIKDSGTLRRSFAHQVHTTADGDVVKIVLSFQYWGRFVDMGVGKGTKLGDVKENATERRLEGRRAGNRRRPKRWYSKVIEKEVFKLGKIMEEEYGMKGFNAIAEEMPKVIKIGL